MPHKRDEIRKLIVDALIHKTHAKENVFNWRIRPVQNEHTLPCISVVIPEERVLEISGAGDLIHRNADVYLVIYNTVAHNEDNMCDEIARKVEYLMNNLNSKKFILNYKKMEISTENLSTKILILCSLHYECSYFTKEIQELGIKELEQISIGVING